MGCWDGNWVGHVRGQHLSSCTLALRPQVLEVLDAIESRTFLVLRYFGGSVRITHDFSHSFLLYYATLLSLLISSRRVLFCVYPLNYFMRSV